MKSSYCTQLLTRSQTPKMRSTNVVCLRKLIKAIILINLVGLGFIVLADGANVTFWDETYQDFYPGRNPKSGVVEVGPDCMNVDPCWGSRVRSIDTNGYCLYLFADKDCTGKAVKIFNYDLAANILQTVGFDKNVQSIKFCNLEASRGFYMYPEVNFKGKPTSVQLPASGACVDVPGTTATLPSSIRAKNSDYCFMIFTKKGCTESGLRIRGNSTYSINNLGQIRWRGKNVQAARLCNGVDNKKYVFDCHTVKSGDNNLETKIENYARDDHRGCSHSTEYI